MSLFEFEGEGSDLHLDLWLCSSLNIDMHFFFSLGSQLLSQILQNSFTIYFPPYILEFIFLSICLKIHYHTYSSINRVRSSVTRRWIQIKCIDLMSEAGHGVSETAAALDLSATPNCDRPELWCATVNFKTVGHPAPFCALRPWPQLSSQSLYSDGMSWLRVEAIMVWFCSRERPECCRSALLPPAVRVKWRCIVCLWCSYNLLYWAGVKGASGFPMLMLIPQDLAVSCPMLQGLQVLTDPHHTFWNAFRLVKGTNSE